MTARLQLPLIRRQHASSSGLRPVRSSSGARSSPLGPFLRFICTRTLMQRVLVSEVRIRLPPVTTTSKTSKTTKQH
jgi:hypothetical protein